jgi:hypothetical protein
VGKGAEDLDELDRLLADSDLMEDEEELDPSRPDLGDLAASPAAVQALVQSSPALAASVESAREACHSARDALARARGAVDREGIGDVTAQSLAAWLACMDELLQFGDGLTVLLNGPAEPPEPPDRGHT